MVDVYPEAGGGRHAGLHLSHLWPSSLILMKQHAGPLLTGHLQLHVVPNEVLLLVLVVRHFLVHQVGHEAIKDLPLPYHLTALLLQFISLVVLKLQ